MSQDALFIVGMISIRCVELTQTGRFTFWFDYSGHVHWVRIYGQIGKWKPNDPHTFDRYVYLDQGDEEQIVIELREILKSLEDKLNEPQSFKIPADGKNQYVVSATPYSSSDGERSEGNSYALGDDIIF